MLYLKRLAELVMAAFVAGAAPVFLDQGLSKAGVAGAVTAGGVAVYGLLVKGLGGDKDRPTVQ
jgi:hypothetical protein